MKVKLDIERHKPNYGPLLNWESCPPFNVNPRGILIHRVRSGFTFITEDGRKRHSVVRYWCGNSGVGEGASLTENPPKERLLCERCEMLAVAAGEKTADKLAGRHVHVGVVRAHRTCCQHTEN